MLLQFASEFGSRQSEHGCSLVGTLPRLANYRKRTELLAFDGTPCGNERLVREPDEFAEAECHAVAHCQVDALSEVLRFCDAS